MNHSILALLILPFFIACNQNEIKQLKKENIALAKTINEKEVAINSFIATLESIEEQLEIIREKEKILAINSKNLNKSQKTKIATTLTSINDILEQNRFRIDDLDKRIKYRWSKNLTFRKLTSKIKDDVTDKEADIVILTEQITKLNIKVEDLSSQINSLNTNVTNLSKQKANNTKLIEEKTSCQNTAFYYVGTASDLEERQIASKKGGIIGIGSTTVLNENFSSTKFRKIDIRKTAIIPIDGKQIDLVTSHPHSSFKFETGKGLSIIDIKQFWKNSKYLVIRVQ